MKIKVNQGSIQVEAVSGKVAEDHFALYVTTREKYPKAEVVCTGLLTQIILYAGADTLHVEGAGDSTKIELPGGWDVAVCASRYTVEILGVRRPSALSPIPFDVV